jgi:hypothetical protein
LQLPFHVALSYAPVGGPPLGILSNIGGDELAVNLLNQRLAREQLAQQFAQTPQSSQALLSAVLQQQLRAQRQLATPMLHPHQQSSTVSGDDQFGNNASLLLLLDRQQGR